MNRWMRRVAALGCGALLLQAGGCSLFDGQAIERILLGSAFIPAAQSAFEAFFQLGAGG